MNTKTYSSPIILLLLVASFVAFCGISAFADGAGNCLDFDGTGDYANGSGISTSLTNIILEAWVYHRTLPASNQRYVTVSGEIAVLRHAGATQQGQLHFYIKTDGVLHSIRVNDALQTGQWVHVAGTWDGTDMKLYLNGEEVGSSTPGGSLNASNGNVGLSSSGETMDGYIDEVRIWNDARTGDEIRANMYTALSGSESGLENYWKLDESSGSTAYDSAGSANITLHNMSSNDWVTSGAFAGPRNALDFDGTEDYVNVGNGTSLDVDNTLTIEAWVKPTDLSSRYGIFSGDLVTGQAGFNWKLGQAQIGLRLRVLEPMWRRRVTMRLPPAYGRISPIPEVERAPVPTPSTSTENV